MELRKNKLVFFFWGPQEKELNFHCDLRSTMLIMIIDRYNFLIRISSSLWGEKVPLIRGNKDCDIGKT